MRIAIVNDVPLTCEALRRIVSTQPGYRIAWTAADGVEAVERTRADRPDLILMDLFMPRMNGAEATRRIMAETPCPILVVTSTVSGHMNQVYEAMGAGALDAVDTPSMGLGGGLDGATALLDKLVVIGKLVSPPPRLAAAGVAHDGRPPLVVIGASTGGPNALAELLASTPETWDACVVIVQHIDPGFAPGLASWLGERTGHRVEIVAEGDTPARHRWLLAGTGDHLVMDAGRRLGYSVEPKEHNFRPSVDVFFSSVAAHWPDPGAAALLTGMGRDGAAGLLKLRRLNWETIAQDEATSVVWGMPRAAAETGAANQVLPLSEIGPALVKTIASRA